MFRLEITLMGVLARVLNLLLKKCAATLQSSSLFNICNEFRTIDTDASSVFPQVKLLRDAPTV